MEDDIDLFQNSIKHLLDPIIDGHVEESEVDEPMEDEVITVSDVEENRSVNITAGVSIEKDVLFDLEHQDLHPGVVRALGPGSVPSCSDPPRHVLRHNGRLLCRAPVSDISQDDASSASKTVNPQLPNVHQLRFETCTLPIGSSARLITKKGE